MFLDISSVVKDSPESSINTNFFGTLTRVEGTKLTNNYEFRKRLRKKMCYLYKFNPFWNSELVAGKSILLTLAYCLEHENGCRDGDIEGVNLSEHGYSDMGICCLSPLIGKSC